jgi:ParE toxin of type II toxin-antitoxin system, parDE
VDARIREQVETLSRFPHSGRLGRIEGTRELVISRTPYIVAYRIAGDTVRILRVLHGARQWPEEMSGHCLYHYCSILIPCPILNPNRCSHKPESLADLVLQKSLIREMQLHRSICE